MKRKRVVSRQEPVADPKSSGRSIPSPDCSDHESERSPSGDDSDGYDLHDANTTLTPSSLHSNRLSDTERFSCTFDGCGKSYTRRARLTEHFRIHTQERIHKCSHDGCTKDFINKDVLNWHIKSAHTDVRDYVCDFAGCDKGFLTASHLKRHKSLHPNRYVCSGHPPCTEVFRKHSTLQTHIISVHEKRRPFPCEYVEFPGLAPCKEAFDTAAGLRKHRGRHHSGQRFWCSQCIAATRADTGESIGERRSNAGGQQGPTQDGDKPLEEFEFATYALLQAHIRAAHPPTCGLCAKVFTRQHALRQHLSRSHPEAGNDDGSPTAVQFCYECAVDGCRSQFAKLYNLKLHQRTVHDGERQFICSAKTDLSSSNKTPGWQGQGACLRAFTTKGNLEEHIRTQHLGLPATARPDRGTAAATAAKTTATTATTADDPSRAGGGGVTKPSNIAELTGLGFYDCPEESGRHLECPLAPGCRYRFTREYDLNVHLHKYHGLFDDDGSDQDHEMGLLSGREGEDVFNELERRTEVEEMEPGPSLGYRSNPDVSADSQHPWMDKEAISMAFPDPGLIWRDLFGNDTRSAIKISDQDLVLREGAHVERGEEQQEIEVIDQEPVLREGAHVERDKEEQEIEDAFTYFASL